MIARSCKFQTTLHLVLRESCAERQPGASADFRQGLTFGFRDEERAIQGLAAQPRAPGRYPVILVIHGDQSPCPTSQPARAGSSARLRGRYGDPALLRAILFFDHVFERGSRAPIGLVLEQPAQTWLQLPPERRQALLDLASEAGDVPGLPAPGLDVPRCNTSYSCQVFTPGVEEAALRLGWTRPGLRYELPLYGEDSDLRAFRLLHLRLLVDPHDVHNRAFAGQELGILLRDLQGREALVTLPPDTPALRRPGSPDAPVGADEVRNLPGSLVVPLAEFSAVTSGRSSAWSLSCPPRAG